MLDKSYYGSREFLTALVWPTYNEPIFNLTNRRVLNCWTSSPATPDIFVLARGLSVFADIDDVV